MEQKPLRILQVLTAMNRAGAETMLMNLYRAVDRDRVQFDFAVSATARCDYDDEIESLGGRIIRYPRYTGKNHFAYKKWWNGFFAAHPEYGIVHGHIGSTASIYLKIAKKYGCYTIAHSHSVGNKANIRSFLYKIYSHNTRYIADYFIGCSTEALVSRYGAKVAADKTRSCILNNGIDIERYKKVKSKRDTRKELKIPEDAFVIGHVGRFSIAKNHEFLVDLFRKIKVKKENALLLMIGEGELKKVVSVKLRKYGLEDSYLILSSRDDVPELMAAMDIFVFPSQYEGLGMALVEAQESKLPCFVSDKVPEHAVISNMVTWLSLRERVKKWAETILSYHKPERIILNDADWNIREITKKLEQIYLDSCPEGNDGKK